MPTPAPNGGAPRGNLQDFVQVFRSDFSKDAPPGTFLARYPNWGAYPSSAIDTNRHGHYHPENLYVSGGVLHFNLKPGDGSPGSAQGNAPYPIPSTGLARLYRRFDVCFQADPVPGWHMAWLLFPTSGTGVWPRDGEIDFPETDLPNTAYAFMHREGATRGNDQDAYNSGVRPGDGQWHIATTIWTPNDLTFIMDGRVIGHSTARVPNTPMRQVLQTETASAPTLAADVRLAWATVYDYVPGTPASS